MHSLHDKRKSGIALVGDLPWGSHFCQFYQTEADLLEVLVPYFRAGLENNEYCIWVAPESLSAENAKKALKEAVPHFEKYEEGLEIMSYSRWRARGGKSGKAVVSGLDRAVSGGFEGLRLACDAMPGSDAHRAFTDRCAGAIRRNNVIAVFTYPRERFDTLGLMDAMKDHSFALVRNAGGWELIESSEARVTRDALKRTEEKLESLFGNMSEGFAYHRIVLDSAKKPCDYVFLEVNAAFERLTGLKGRRILGRKVTEVLPGIENDPAGWIGKYGRVALSGKPMRFESYAEALGRWYSVSAFSPHKGYFAVTFSDITERKRAEESLRESEERWATTLASIGDAVISTDAEGRITFMNAVAEALTGWDLSDASARPVEEVFNIINEHTRAEVGSPVGRVLREGKVVGLANHTTLVRKDGTEVPIDDSGAPIRGRDGRTVGAVLVFRDISERRKAERELKKHREHLEEMVEARTSALMETNVQLEQEIAERTRAETELRNSERRLKEAERVALLGHWELDLASNTLVWSDEVYRIFDLEPQQFGASYEAFLDAVHPEDRELVNRAYTESVRNRTPYDIVHRLLTKDDREKFVNERCRTDYGEDGKPLRSFGTVMDITARMRAEDEKKRLESRLRHAQKLEALGQMAGGIAHDFNNRLAAITNFASLIKMKMQGDDPMRNHVDLLMDSAQKAAQLTYSLLRFSRKEVTELKPVDINRLMEDSVKFLRRLVREDIDLGIELSDTGLTVMANWDQIDNVLMNLAINASDAMPMGGRLIVTTESVRMDGAFVRAHGFGQPGDYARMSVSDTGLGMDEATKDRVFEPFFTTKEVGKGTGLGLSTVYGIVKQHRGYINVYSEPGRGSTFNIYLPLAGSDALPEEAEEEHPQGGTETILLAEDEAMVRESAKAMLEAFGYKVIEAVDGEDAVGKFRENENAVDLLLLDLVMPKMSGEKVFHEIAKMKPSVKALFMSGYPADALREGKSTQLSGGNFLYKPISHDKLLKTVREVLDRRDGS